MRLSTDKQHEGVRWRKLARAGFTLVEVMAGMAILGLAAGSIIYGLNQLNHFATANRLYTAAQTLAQNQIDLILTMGPYDPAAGKYPVPDTCGAATSTNTILRTDAPYYYDPTRTTSCPMSLNANDRKVTLYKDPMNPVHRGNDRGHDQDHHHGHRHGRGCERRPYQSGPAARHGQRRLHLPEQTVLRRHGNDAHFRPMRTNASKIKGSAASPCRR